MSNNFIYVHANTRQEYYEIQEITFHLKMRNTDHTKSLTTMKYFFVIVAFITSLYYYRAVKRLKFYDLL